jgi:hypothetical protein
MQYNTRDSPDRRHSACTTGLTGPWLGLHLSITTLQQGFYLIYLTECKVSRIWTGHEGDERRALIQFPLNEKLILFTGISHYD